MSTNVETREALAQPQQAMANNAVSSGGNTSEERPEDQPQRIDTKPEQREKPEEQSSKHASSARSPKQRKRTKTGCLSQIPLPVIAPNPTQQEHQIWTGMKSYGMMPPYPDRPYDTSAYTPSDLPPHVLQKIAQRNGSLDTSPVTPKTDTFVAHQTSFSSKHQPGHHADRDSGIDAPSNHDLSINQPQHQDPTDALSEALFQPAAVAPQQEPWPMPNSEYGSDQYLPSQLPNAVQDCYEPNEALSTVNYGSSYDQAALQGYGHFHGNAMTPQINSQISNNMPPDRNAIQYNPTVLAPYHPSLEDPEDDYFDVTSDEEQGDQDYTMSDATASNLGVMLALSANQTDGGLRSFNSFLTEPNILASYRPPYSVSPLMDPQTARIFCHFVTATAPTLSLHNRHPVNPSVMFTGAPVPAFQRSLFTYTLPMMALSNQALLHSLLALASMHIAKLQQTSATASLKHYHYALRRVAKAVGHPTKRREIATLAATLLLGYFEVSTAEHNKWNSHLAGARELILEIDFAGMTKRINAYKAETNMIRKGGMHGYGHNQHYNSQRRMSFDILRTDKDLDENLVSTLMGYRTRYNEYGQVVEATEPPSHYHIPLTSKDVEKFEIQCDLFWWYAKQDMYQSLISGNRLLMDHLVLLFARLTEFSARDLARKIKAQAKADESKQRMATQDPPSWKPSQFSQPMSRSSQPARGAPPMYGMMPAPGRIHLPPAFDQSRHDHLNEANKVTVKEAELEAATYAAEREWSDIWSALDILEQALGLDFQPLSPDHMTPLSTPFGPALYYRTYSIACLWSLFNTARIFACRVAPGMPPAAMVAAGVAAPRTAPWCNTIGRICAGLQPVSTTTPLNPSHGAALMDSCMGLFHAGIQFRDAAQRGWTITKLRDIARLTGWQTAALIASGCERAWIAAAESGRGPPYTRTMNSTAKDDRVSGRSRGADLGPPKDNNDRRFITVNPGTRVYWALGILGAEEDMKQLKLD
ncbi:MAG: hypothetical protein Q9172_004821 [Xanthocarpia lactea]